MKGKLLIVVIMLLVCISCTFFACSNDNASSKKEKVESQTMELVIMSDPVYTKTIDIKDVEIVSGLFTIFEDNNISYNMSGGMITSIGELDSDFENGLYIDIYTNVEIDKDNTATAKTINYNGTALTNINKMPNNLTISNGTIIYIVLE